MGTISEFANIIFMAMSSIGVGVTIALGILNQFTSRAIRVSVNGRLEPILEAARVIAAKELIVVAHQTAEDLKTKNSINES